MSVTATIFRRKTSDSADISYLRCYSPSQRAAGQVSDRGEHRERRPPARNPGPSDREGRAIDRRAMSNPRGLADGTRPRQRTPVFHTLHPPGRLCNFPILRSGCLRVRPAAGRGGPPHQEETAKRADGTPGTRREQSEARKAIVEERKAFRARLDSIGPWPNTSDGSARPSRRC